jgi:hypothetical protein
MHPRGLFEPTRAGRAGPRLERQTILTQLDYTHPHYFRQKPFLNFLKRISGQLGPETGLFVGQTRKSADIRLVADLFRFTCAVIIS